MDDTPPGLAHGCCGRLTAAQAEAGNSFLAAFGATERALSLHGHHPHGFGLVFCGAIHRPDFVVSGVTVMLRGAPHVVCIAGESVGLGGQTCTVQRCALFLTSAPAHVVSVPPFRCLPRNMADEFAYLGHQLSGGELEGRHLLVLCHPPSGLCDDARVLQRHLRDLVAMVGPLGVPGCTLVHSGPATGPLGQLFAFSRRPGDLDTTIGILLPKGMRFLPRRSGSGVPPCGLRREAGHTELRLGIHGLTATTMAWNSVTAGPDATVTSGGELSLLLDGTMGVAVGNPMR
jgi:hypothetical protein